ncbi:hypothetical protein PDTK01_36470 [Phycicoccus sp. DTK01]|nr:hypothetical protein PDTK01_36470 [Phycicoccus sp. DTK01]
MGRRDDEQRARRAALEGQSSWRAERAAKDARCSRLGVEVAVALRERDVAVAAAEARAAAALAGLTESEGLSLTEALRWCGGLLGGAEAVRLRRAARLALVVEVDGDPTSAETPAPSAQD